MKTKRNFCMCNDHISKPSPEEIKLRTRHAYFSPVRFIRTGRAFIYLNTQNELIVANCFLREKKLNDFHYGVHLGVVCGRPYSSAYFKEEDRSPKNVGKWVKKETKKIENYKNKKNAMNMVADKIEKKKGELEGLIKQFQTMHSSEELRTNSKKLKQHIKKIIFS